MTNEPSPRPWHFNGMRPTIYSDEKLPDGSARVVLDIETDHLPLLPCDENDRQLIADIGLIVTAVNERDRLRDIVRRMARVAQDALDFAESMCDLLRIPDNPERAKARYEIEALLREARETIGEDRP